MILRATNGYGSEKTKNFNMNVSGTEDEVGFEARGMDKDESEDENNTAIDKCTKPKVVKPAKNAIHPSNNMTHPSYDPNTCCENVFVDHLWQAFKWTCFNQEWGQPSLLKDGEQDSNFWIILKAKANVAIKWSDDWDESP
ncbi:hypothetical protein HD554DRAFT_2042387 [Boletus coccyginus]|nr:hypothetical protein HD554DRAFT_2042387 [Boletus coccyginus]